MEVPNYGPGAGLLGTAAATLAGLKLNNSNFSQGYISQVDDSSKTIETLKEENESLKAKVELLEMQFKFILNKYTYILNKITEVEQFMESRK